MFIKMRQRCFPRACLQQLRAVLELLTLPGPYSPRGDEMGKMLEDGQGGQRPLVPAPWRGVEVLKCKHLVSKEITTTHTPKQAQRCAALWDQQPAIPCFKECKLASRSTRGLRKYHWCPCTQTQTCGQAIELICLTARGSLSSANAMGWAWGRVKWN